MGQGRLTREHPGGAGQEVLSRGGRVLGGAGGTVATVGGHPESGLKVLA